MTTIPQSGAFDAIMQAFATDAAMQSLEGGADPVFGSVSWRTLVSGDRHPSSGLVAGIAEFGPWGTLNPHRHGPAEMYFGLEGEGTVTVDGVPHRIAPGLTIYVPGEAEHGVVAGEGGLRFLYVFPVDRFDQVDYRFS